MANRRLRLFRSHGKINSLVSTEKEVQKLLGEQRKLNYNHKNVSDEKLTPDHSKVRRSKLWRKELPQE